MVISETNEVSVIKEIDAEDSNVVAEHLGEARLLMSLGHHPHIVRCTDCFMSDGKFCIL